MKKAKKECVAREEEFKKRKKKNDTEKGEIEKVMNGK